MHSKYIDFVDHKKLLISRNIHTLDLFKNKLTNDKIMSTL